MSAQGTAELAGHPAVSLAPDPVRSWSCSCHCPSPVSPDRWGWTAGGGIGRRPHSPDAHILVAAQDPGQRGFELGRGAAGHVLGEGGREEWAHSTAGPEEPLHAPSSAPSRAQQAGRRTGGWREGGRGCNQEQAWGNSAGLRRPSEGTFLRD